MTAKTLDKLDHDILFLIFKKLDESDRQSLALVNKQLRQLHRMKFRFDFVIKGHRDGAFCSGIKFLRRLDMEVDKLIIKNFDLQSALVDKLPKVLSMRDTAKKPVTEDSREDRICDASQHINFKNIRHLTLQDCIVTVSVLDILNLLFSRVDILEMNRCCAASVSLPTASKNVQKRGFFLTKWKLTEPFIGDEKAVRPVFDFCLQSKRVQLELHSSFCSEGREVVRRWLKKYEKRAAKRHRTRSHIVPKNILDQTLQDTSNQISSISRGDLDY